MIAVLETVCGTLWVSGDTDTIESVSWSELAGPFHTGELDWIMTALMTYFSGRSRAYPGGACFLNKRIVWKREVYPSEPKTRTQQILHKITQIPYGTTTSYGSIARSLGNIRLARAVGNACGSNPLPVIIPCHRVVGATSLGGYSSGVSRKRCLLELERNSMNQS